MVVAVVEAVVVVEVIEVGGLPFVTGSFVVAFVSGADSAAESRVRVSLSAATFVSSTSGEMTPGGFGRRLGISSFA